MFNIFLPCKLSVPSLFQVIYLDSVWISQGMKTCCCRSIFFRFSLILPASVSSLVVSSSVTEDAQYKISWLSVSGNKNRILVLSSDGVIYLLDDQMEWPTCTDSVPSLWKVKHEHAHNHNPGLTIVLQVLRRIRHAESGDTTQLEIA